MKKAKEDFVGCKRLSLTINKELWLMSRKNNLNWSECLRIGITAKLRDLGVKVFNNPLQQSRRERKLIETIDALTEELKTLKAVPKDYNSAAINIKSNEV